MADTGLRMNIAALKRVDPYARDIVDSATHVALYTFEENEWEKTSIEGALFVYSRNGEPQHSLLIMNRLNTNNLVEPVSRGLELQLKEPFLLYRNSKCRIFGIWFYDKDECVRVATKLNGLVKDSVKFPNSNETVPQNHVMPAPATGSVDIFSMLSKAQDDYNSNKGKVSNKNDNPGPRAPDLTSQSVMDFFAKAGSGTNQMPVAPPVASASLFAAPGTSTSDVHDAPLLLQRLMSNPAHSVEHIEKQQRSVTPQETSSGNGNISLDVMMRQNSNFQVKPSPADKPNQVSGQQKVAKNKKSNHKNQVEATPSNGQPHLENGFNFMRISSPKSSSPLATFLNQSQDVSHVVNAYDESLYEAKPLCSTINNCVVTPQQPALMPPTMFTASGDDPLPPLNPLTRNQLLQAFNYLLKNDAEFVNKLHEGYIKSFDCVS